jgi:hypothetical protein
MRSNRIGARDNSPNRISRRSPLAKSAIPHNTRISTPLEWSSGANEDTSPQKERKKLKIGETQIRSSAVQGLLFGSSSSVMLRLIGHGIVSEKNLAVGMAGAGISFHRRKETFAAAMLPLDFECSVRLCHARVKFKLLIAKIRKAHFLLRTPLHLLV